MIKWWLPRIRGEGMEVMSAATALDLDCGGSYMNLYIGKGHTELYTHRHMRDQWIRWNSVDSTNVNFLEWRFYYSGASHYPWGKLRERHTQKLYFFLYTFGIFFGNFLWNFTHFKIKPWRRKWQPTPALLPGKSHGQRSLVDYSPWGGKESNTTERLHFKIKSIENTWIEFS